MNEPFCFKLISTLPIELVDGVKIELLAIDKWVGHTTKALGTNHRKAIGLRMSKHYPRNGIGPIEMIGTCVDTAHMQRCPLTKSLISGLMVEHGWSELGQVSTSRMTPGGIIRPHIDGGAYFSHFHRVHVSLQSGDGVDFTCEDETISMKTGEVWIFDNKRVHSVRNKGAVERINLFFDAR